MVRVPSVASGVLLFIAALDEGSAFESGRRPGPMLNSVDDNEDIFLRDEEPWAPSGIVGG